LFIAALFTIAKLWKQPRYPSIDKWIKIKIVFSPSYADFRSRANAIVLLDLVHMLRGEHIQED
jgi:hypothetical protein